MSSFAFFPEQASTYAPHVDELYFALVAVTAFFTIVISVLILFFAVKYRRRPGNEIATETPEHKWMEISWSLLPLVVGMVLFVWGTKIYLESYHSDSADTLHLYGVGKQWMWKFQHADGRREINDLHVPIGVPIKMTLISQDVIHSFYVPAFRVKHDVLPMRYTEVSFTATKPGVYHLFCAEYCGTEHSRMVGKVYAMSPVEYEEWLASPIVEGGPPRTTDFGGGRAAGAIGSPTGDPVDETVSVAANVNDPVARGNALLETLGCRACHKTDTEALAPKLEGIYGIMQPLEGGSTVKVDETYIRESILTPQNKIVKGYTTTLMTPFAGIITEDQIIQVIQYTKSTAGSK